MDTSRLRQKILFLFNEIDKVKDKLIARKPMARGTVYELKRETEMRKQSYQEIEEKTIEKLHRRMGTRDDKKVARYIHKNRAMDGIYEFKKMAYWMDFMNG